mmetsp:Transcript_8300/g.12420  ORF Transcript_8300/g.12420 Transcript_8300/m.12420 type:complete len:87 (+) Transcript_8300:316-576(+)
MLINTEAADPYIDLLRIQIVGFTVVREHIHNIADRISPRVADHDRCWPHMIVALKSVDISGSLLAIDRTNGILSLLANDAVRVMIA